MSSTDKLRPVLVEEQLVSSALSRRGTETGDRTVRECEFVCSTTRIAR
jgi:hypothetical protein